MRFLLNEYLLSGGILILSYLMGSIPFGYLVVKFTTGKDLRQVESGRTGGTNALRAGGCVAGAFTTIFDFLKGMFAVWLARYLLPSDLSWKVWIEVLAPLAAILGHNYSIFLIERKDNGRLRLRGGAGGAPTVGGAAGLWWPSALIIIPISLSILFGVGYASVATMSMAGLAILIFAIGAWVDKLPWQYIFYGIFAEIILVIALRPNIVRLMNGTERLVGWRARRKNKKG
jgi:acyl phosphate:glycerol-3-phosphate acyltransferase